MKRTVGIHVNIVFPLAGTYAKYRQYASDAANSHFRLVAFVGISLNNSVIVQQEIDLIRNNILNYLFN